MWPVGGGPYRFHALADPTHPKTVITLQQHTQLLFGHVTVVQVGDKLVAERTWCAG
jgi:hypothetical protein